MSSTRRRYRSRAWSRIATTCSKLRASNRGIAIHELFEPEMVSRGVV
jgi:hypothetical protein